jgi:hypothetical protein
MKKTIFCICALMALVSCKKEKIEGPAGPQGPAGNNGNVPSGAIAGKVRQYDQHGIEYTTGLNTTTVSLEGTTMSSVTDVTGNYTISNVPPGVYNLAITKPGAGLIKQEQVTFPGNGTLFNSNNVSDLPSFTLSNGYIKDTTFFGNTQVKVNFNLPAANKARAVALVFGSSPAVDIANNASYSVLNQLTVSANSSVVQSQFGMGGSGFNAFPAGSTVYVKIYPVSVTGNSYYNYINDRNVYTSYGTPFPTTFTLTKQ